jgi:peptidoglycan hydrolase FlgJ
MTQIPAVGAAQAPRDSAHDARLRRTAQQLEGVFVQQLFKAMRDTVPENELAGGGLGEEIFTGLMDQNVADSAAGRWERGLGGAIYRQLSARTESATAQQVKP